MVTKCPIRLLAYPLLVAALNACSFHPARRVPVEGILIESREVETLKIAQARTFDDGGVLCVEGIVESSQGAHDHMRGAVLVSAFDDKGTLLEKVKDCFMSSEEPRTYRLQIDHNHSSRRFDIQLTKSPHQVKKLVIAPDLSNGECS